MSPVNRRGVIKSLTTSSALFTTLSIFPQKGKTTSNLDEATMLSMGDKYRLDSGEDVSFLNGLVKHSFLFHRNIDRPDAHAFINNLYLFSNFESDNYNKPSDVTREDIVFIVDSNKYPVHGPKAVPHHKISSFYDGIKPSFRPSNSKMRMPQRTAGGVYSPVPYHLDEVDLVGVGIIESGTSPDVIWRFDTEPTRKFNSKPEVRVKKFEISSPIEFNASVNAKIAVENRGGDGVFRGTLGWDEATHPRAIELEVEAESTNEFDVPLNFPRSIPPNQKKRLKSSDRIRFVLKDSFGKTATSDTKLR